MDYYQVIGANKNDTIDEIKKKYQIMARKFHPDRNKNDPNATNKFLELQVAYKILCDPQQRALYDNYDVDDFNDLSHILKADSDDEYNNSSDEEYNTDSDNDDEKTYWDSERWPDKANIYLKYTLGLEDIYKGCIKKLTIDRINECTVEPFEFEHQVYGPTIRHCYIGKSTTKDTIILKLDPWDPNQSYDSRGCIPFENMGNILPPLMQKKYNRERGTLFLVPTNIIDGFDIGYNPYGSDKKPENIYKELEITGIEAILGFSKRIKHPIGKYLIIKDWGEIIANNTLKKIEGWGLPIYGSNNRYGDLYIRFKVDKNIKLTKKKKEKIAKIILNNKVDNINFENKILNEDIELEIKESKIIVDEYKIWNNK